MRINLQKPQMVLISGGLVVLAVRRAPRVLIVTVHGRPRLSAALCRVLDTLEPVRPRTPRK